MNKLGKTLSSELSFKLYMQLDKSACCQFENLLNWELEDQLFNELYDHLHTKLMKGLFGRHYLYDPK